MSPAALWWLLVAARLWALFRLQPAWRLLLGPWWDVVAAGLAAILALVPAFVGTVGPSATTWTTLALLVLGELLVGTLMGMVASLPAYALIGAATGSAVVLRTPPKPVVALTVALVLAAGLSLGLHHPLITATLDTLVVVPIGEFGPDALRSLDLAGAAATMLVLALSLVTPALLAGVALEISARLIGRGPGPATAATQIAPWLRLAAAMTALGASWSAYVPAWTTALLPP